VILTAISFSAFLEEFLIPPDNVYEVVSNGIKNAKEAFEEIDIDCLPGNIYNVNEISE